MSIAHFPPDRNLRQPTKIILLFALAIFISIACHKSDLDPEYIKIAYTGIYGCKEEYGQTFAGSIDMPTEPGEKASLVNESLDFLVEIQPGSQKGLDAFSLNYYYEAHLLIPKIFYYDGKIQKIEQEDQYHTQKTKNKVVGETDADGWFSGKWVQATRIQDASTGQGDVETTFQFIGVVSRTTNNPRVLLCSWYQSPDLKIAKIAGIESFSDFCKDLNYNYFYCPLKERKKYDS